MNANDDKTQLDQLVANPVEQYFKIRKSALQQLKGGASDFTFPYFAPILRKIIVDIECQSDSMFFSQLKDVAQKAQRLESLGFPFKAVHRFIMLDYLPLMDQIFCEVHPELMSNEFHRKNAAPLLEMILGLAPEILPIYTFESVGFDFFLRTRCIPMPLLGINLSGLKPGEPVPFADRFPMKISEFTWHDWGHLAGMARKDLEYINSSGKPSERVISEWNVTKDRVLELRRAYKNDQDLYDAITLILMEFLHERGFQYSLTVLKNELDTPKWEEIITRKKERGFFSSFRHNPKAFDRLSQARQILLQGVSQFRVEDQVQWYRTLRADLVPVKITHTPALDYNCGKLHKIVLQKGRRPMCHLRTKKGESQISFDDLILAQVDPVKRSPLTTDRINQVRLVLAGINEKSLIRSVVLDSNLDFWGCLESGAAVQLEDHIIETQNLAEAMNSQMPPIEIFEIEQVLGASERNEFISFTWQPEIKVYSGRLSTLNQGFNLDCKMKVHLMDSEEVLYLPLVEIRIDPLVSVK